MSTVVVGLSHHTSDVALRERMAFPEDRLPEALADLRRSLEGGGAVILSTCNRSEIYVNHSGDPDDLCREIRRFLTRWHELPEDDFASRLYQLHDREAVGHLFRVAASLDSLVMGEDQILGQVHDAYITAHREQATDKVINTLFQKSFTVAKKIRSTTAISAGKVSVSSVAVDLAVSVFMDLSDKTVMVIGSGDMGELTLKSLMDKGVSQLIVANRSLENACALADRYRGEAVALDDLAAHLHRADIVISSTGAPVVILHKDTVRQALKQRSRKPMLIIDIAVPRDVEAGINDLDNIYLYDMDALQGVADQNMESRRNELDRCLNIADAGTDQFMKWLQTLAAEPTIVSLSRELNAIRDRELAKTLDTLSHLPDTDKEEVAYLAKRIVNNILQQPMNQIKQEVQHADHASVLQLVRRLFGLKEST
jgi:glutamyl-tRNA reductase